MNVIPNPDNRPHNWMRVSRLEGLTALVAGGGSGIGEAVARIFAANGARVAVTDLRAEEASRVATSIKGEGGQAISAALDVSNQDQIDAGVAATTNAWGQIDILVNCAAAVLPGRLEDWDRARWRKSFEVNVEGAIMLARTCLPHLRRSANASVVNVSSLAGNSGYPNGGAYGPSKAALVSVTRQMALEWAEYGVRVNVVSPGTTSTPLMRAVLTPEVIKQREARIPLGRLGFASELADTIVFLASPMASYITGQNLNCDGGLSQALMVQKFNDI